MIRQPSVVFTKSDFFSNFISVYGEVHLNVLPPILYLPSLYLEARKKNMLKDVSVFKTDVSNWPPLSFLLCLA